MRLDLLICSLFALTNFLKLPHIVGKSRVNFKKSHMVVKYEVLYQILKNVSMNHCCKHCLTESHLCQAVLYIKIPKRTPFM